MWQNKKYSHLFKLRFITIFSLALLLYPEIKKVSITHFETKTILDWKT